MRLSGGQEQFHSAMNKKVRAMGMRHTRFYTPSGLDKKRRPAKATGKWKLTQTSPLPRSCRYCREAFSNAPFGPSAGKIPCNDEL